MIYTEAFVFLGIRVYAGWMGVVVFSLLPISVCVPNLTLASVTV